MKILSHNSKQIIEYSKGLFIKEQPDPDKIGLTTDPNEATQYDSEEDAHYAIIGIHDQVKAQPIIIPAQDITEEVEPTENETIAIVIGFCVFAGFMGWLFVKISGKIFVN